MRSSNTLLFVRGVLLMAVAIAVFFGLELALDVAGGGYPLDRLAFFDVADARHFNNLLNRSLNQLLGVVFTTVAIAVPLTANLYSLKFLEFFIQDRVNAAVLILAVLVNLGNTWAGYALKANQIPVLQLNFIFLLSIVSFALLFPYLYYIFRFLHPSTLLARLENENVSDLRAASRRPGIKRGEVAANLEHLANIALRSVERGDRNTAIEGVLALERTLRHYWTVKPGLPPAWFEADQNFFLGFSSAAVDDLTASRSWVEMKLFGQLQQVVGAAIGRMPDVTSTCAKSLRKLGLEAAARSDPALRELVAEYFNTLIRLALNRRDARAVFTVFDQYRLFAETINAEYPDLALEIAFYFQYYGQVARDTQQTFVAEAVAYDLGALVQAAWKTGAPNREQLLERFLHYDEQARHPLKGVKKAQAILASALLQYGQPQAAATIQAAWRHLEPDLVRQVRDELLFVQREKFWEVNERRMNIDYVPAPQRERLHDFFAALEAAAGA